MELHHLRCAVAVAEHRSFTRAAASLYLTQPSLSYVVRKLEEELGQQLFERRARSVEVTEAGTVFLDAARRALIHADRARSAVDDVKHLRRATLRLAATAPALSLAAHSLVRLRARHPELFVLVHDSLSDVRIVELVRSGHADVGLVRGGSAPGELGSRVAQVYDVVAVIPARWEDRPRSAELSLADIANYPLISPRAGSFSHSRLLELFAEHGLTPVVAAETDSDVMAIELVRLGMGVALVAVDRIAALDTSGLATYCFAPGRDQEIKVIYRRRARVPGVEAFLDTLEAPRQPRPSAVHRSVS